MDSQTTDCSDNHNMALAILQEQGQDTPLHLLFQAKKNVRHFLLLLCFLHHILQGKGESTRCKIFLALTDLSLTNHAM